ncbi:MAG: hypothetical protein U5O39_05175 [Gammaproteobacteria bacterium]|nr:hypothetical protein [Gammaproteobacteria bacterium]
MSSAPGDLVSEVAAAVIDLVSRSRPVSLLPRVRRGKSSARANPADDGDVDQLFLDEEFEYWSASCHQILNNKNVEPGTMIANDNTLLHRIDGNFTVHPDVDAEATSDQKRIELDCHPVDSVDDDKGSSMEAFAANHTPCHHGDE